MTQYRKFLKSMAVAVAILMAVFFTGMVRGRKQSTVVASAPAIPVDTISVSIPEIVTMPAGTKIQIRLAEMNYSDPISPGTKFSAYLYGPLWLGGKFLAPSRTEASGEFVDVNWADAAEGGAVTLILKKLVVGGKKYHLETQPLTLRAARENDTARNGGRQGIALAGAWIAEISRAKSPITFTLSAPVELPVIRKLGGPVARAIPGKTPMLLEASSENSRNGE